jgi:crossover junction endodeoxyribonuclease RuvC
MKILALDPSLTATGYAVGTAPELGTLTPPASVGKGLDRLVWLRDQALALAAGADLVVLEGYSYASKGRAIISLGEFGGVLRVALMEAGVPFVEVAPAGRAKYATGKGNAKKEAVLTEAVRRLGYAGHDNNEADALWLYAMAADHFGAPLAAMPQTHRAALDAVPWPDVPNTLEAAA